MIFTFDLRAMKKSIHHSIPFFLVLTAICFISFSKPELDNKSDRYYTTSSHLAFISDAPLEVIKAESKELKGVIDPDTRSFAFSVNNHSFQGFNSPLQKEHFNENYLETEKYPVCTYSGKIIDDVDFNKPGTYMVRTKGMMNIKGVGREKIVRSKLIVKENTLELISEFVVLLDDHNIRIPRIVYQKIAPEIQVKLDAVLELQQNP